MKPFLNRIFSMLTNDALCLAEEQPVNVDGASLLDVMSQSGVLFSGQGAVPGWIDTASTRSVGIRVKTEIVGKLGLRNSYVKCNTSILFHLAYPIINISLNSDKTKLVLLLFS